MSLVEEKAKVGARIGRGFLKSALIYFLLGAVWLGFEHFIPEPISSTAQVFYNLARTHVMNLGWASFSIIGLIYLAVPRFLDTKLASDRLAKAHFWVTSLVFPIAILTLTSTSFLMDPFVGSGMSTDEALFQASVAPVFLTYFLSVLIGIGIQFIFAYNMFKTMGGK